MCPFQSPKLSWYGEIGRNRGSISQLSKVAGEKKPVHADQRRQNMFVAHTGTEAETVADQLVSKKHIQVREKPHG